MSQSPEEPVAPPPASRLGRALMVLAFAGSSAGGLALIVLAVGGGDARDLAGVLLVLGGALFAPYCLWAYGQPPRAQAPEWAPSPSQEAAGGLALSIAMAGGGVECLAPDGPWLLLCLPLVLVFVWLARYVRDNGPGERSERQTRAVACLLFAAGILAVIATGFY